MSQLPGAVEPITEDDSSIARALEEAHLPSLMAAIVHLTGDLSPLNGDIKPVYDFFGDGQGGLTDTQRERARNQALAALSKYRGSGKLAAPLSEQTIRRMMNFVAGAEIPERYVPFLMEELALEGHDVKAAFTGQGVPENIKKNFHVLIVGAGMSGLLAAIRLKQAGISFTIIDKNKDVGGTWHVNTYPGCRVDNPNHLYSYSFEPNHDWPQHYSTQPVLNSYFQNVAKKYGIRELVRYETGLEEAVYDENRAIWKARLNRNGRSETIEANAIITAVGQLNRPKYPDVKGRESFKGVSFHSAEWDHSVDLKGKRVAVIGTGASAFQFVPEIAPDVKEMFVFQRNAPWLGPTPNYHDNVGEGTKWLLKHVPYYAKWYRFWLFWMLTDGIYEFVKADPEWNARKDSVGANNDMLREMLTATIAPQVAGKPELLSAVIPTYPPGGKRSVRDNGVWIGALKRDNVHVVTDPLAEITPAGLKTKDGKEYPVDVIIYGTGFQASHFLEPMKFKGRGGIDLHEMWNGDARAYLGITIPNFPNLFCMYGPNTNIVVNGSIIFFSECEMRYIMGCIELLLQTRHAAMEPRKDVHDEFNKKIDAGNLQMAWGAAQVTSWYKNEKGRVSQNWPFPLVDYWQATRAPNPADFEFREARTLQGAAE
jgi:4-hydroxyacetophenone monooxygenase